MSESYDVLVVGAGIVGLATARALLLERPGLRVAVLEKEAEVAQHQTGHNSGVVHSGIYYAPGSLKAELCRRGKAELERYADVRGIEIIRRGKLIVALEEAELPRLEELERRASLNGVAGMRVVDSAELRAIEPHAVGIRALHASETGVIDYSSVARSLAEDLRNLGAELLFGREVRCFEIARREMVAHTRAGSVRGGNVICCAGLQSDRLAQLAGVDLPARIVPFRGDYYTVEPTSEHLVRGLLYPVPDPEFPFLGVHFTKQVDGKVVVGPNAVLALARERYRRLAINPRDALSAVGYKGVRQFARRHIRMAATELWRDISKSAFVQEMKRYIPEISASDVRFGPTGIRAQAMTRDGGLVDDFLIVPSHRMMHVLNAPSPAATACFAIGDEIATRACTDLLR